MQGRKIRHLSTVQRPFALNITKAYRPTSSSALNAVAGLLPLHIRIEEEAARQLVKQLKRPVTFDDELFLPEDFEPQATHLHIHPSTKGRGVRIKGITTVLEQPSDITVYTDGSKIDNKVGRAFIALCPPIIIHKWQGVLRDFNSIFQSEAIAMEQTIQYLQQKQIREATIQTDSLSVLHAINNAEHSSPTIASIQQRLRENNEQSYMLEWTKAHVGDYGNEMADSLAKDAALGGTSGPVNIPWPISHLKKSLRLHATSKWQEEWDQGETGRRTYYHLSYVDPGRTISNPQLIRYITGHGPFPEYFAKRGISETDICSCGEVGTPEHYVTTCPLTTGLHIPIPQTNRQAFCKFLIKQRHFIYKLTKVMDKLSALGTDLCQTA
ncbi:uncharacterized protein LOC118184140 [Stegodyphus dumicola]|uniref:uncharacterized protein LOC118184140 n=1 Tax=Stegodyphus dumicola TaxID=202533 RepID=UPI0015AF1284|nr:uncharacterized protein LOC118184140 [Stegodyphus dumicola]